MHYLCAVMRKKWISLVFAMLLSTVSFSQSGTIFSPRVKSLEVWVNGDWLAPPVLRLNSGDVLSIGFDEMSHGYHRYIYVVEHREADWSLSDELFESDYLEGFNGMPIDDYEHSINTTVDYTHYSLSIPNSNCRLKISGNYRLHVYDDDNDREEVLSVDFMVSEDVVPLSLTCTGNTDISFNTCHQQISMHLDYGQLQVTNPDEQLSTVIMQNFSRRDSRCNVKPDIVSPRGLEWSHSRELIFDAGNEYHKFEVLDVSHPTMGIDQIYWDGQHFHALPFVDEPRAHYVYDEDANGAFLIRNSDNRESHTTSDYVLVDYRLRMAELPAGMNVAIDGWWTSDASPSAYLMTYDVELGEYRASLLLPDVPDPADAALPHRHHRNGPP